MKKSTYQKYDAGYRLVTQYLMYGDKYFHKKDNRRRKKIFKAITPQDINAFFQKYFSDSEKIYVSILTGEKEPKYYSYEKIQQILTNKKEVNKKQKTSRNKK